MPTDLDLYDVDTPVDPETQAATEAFIASAWQNFLDASPEEQQFMAGLFVGTLFGMSQAELVIAFRYSSQDLFEFLPRGLDGDRAVLMLLQLSDDEAEAVSEWEENYPELPSSVKQRLRSRTQLAKDRRALAEAFIKAFKPLPLHVLVACRVELQRLRTQIARSAGLSRVRSRCKEVGALGGGIRIAALPCTPHAP